MEEIFNSSLIISLGPSGRKALDFSKKLLGYLPGHFLNLIDYYEVESLQSIAKELQEIIDTKLLSAKNLNKLVDLGYKVRSENISAVRLNLYLFWDVYSSSQSAYEAVKAISELNFGNIDKNQHSGASLYIIPMMEREWVIEENKGMEAIEALGNIISFISKEESMLAMDSKVFVLHAISNDGTRIPMEELASAGGMITYLNILPSKEPPLAQFNRRLLREEGAYKVGTIGIAGHMISKDKLLEDFSKYLSIDILRHAADYEANENYKNYDIFKLIDFESQKNVLSEGVTITQHEEGYRLASSEDMEIKLGRDGAQYPAVFKAWEEYIEKQCLVSFKGIIDKNAAENEEALIKNIEADLRHMIENCSLKEALNYINTLEKEISKQKSPRKPYMHIDTLTLNEELRDRVNKSSKLLANLYHRFAIKSLHCFMDNYKEQILKKAGNLINVYIEKAIEEGYKRLISHLAQRKQLLYRCIDNAKELSTSISQIQEHEEYMGSLITDLLSFQDRHNLYIEKRPKASEAYKDFLANLQSFEELADKTLSDKLKEYTIKVSQAYIDIDFFDYMSVEAISMWIDKGMVKSKYLLQFTSNESLEEHAQVISPAKVQGAVKGATSGKLSTCQVKVVEGEPAYINCMAIIRFCLGVSIDNITSVRKLKEKHKTNADLDTL
jgi:hypothetical protein